MSDQQKIGAALQELGFDWGGLVSNLANTGEGIKTSVEKDKAEKQAAKDAAANADKAIAADAAWANAEANVVIAPSDATRTAASLARASAQKAGAVLDTAGTTKRCATAQNALSASVALALAAPTDLGKQAKMHAWQLVAAECNAPTQPGYKGGDLTKTSGGTHWLLQKKAGLPVYAWGLFGVGALTALFFIIRGLRKKK